MRLDTKLNFEYLVWNELMDLAFVVFVLSSYLIPTVDILIFILDMMCLKYIKYINKYIHKYTNKYVNIHK